MQKKALGERGAPILKAQQRMRLEHFDFSKYKINMLDTHNVKNLVPTFERKAAFAKVANFIGGVFERQKRSSACLA